VCKQQKKGGNKKNRVEKETQQGALDMCDEAKLYEEPINPERRTGPDTVAQRGLNADQ